MMRAILQGARTWKRRWRAFLVCCAFGLACVFHADGNAMVALAQQPKQWTPQQTIPNYYYDTNTPYLIADQNYTVHAFSSQWLGDEEEGTVRAIVYNQWTRTQGWSTPIDVMLSPVNEARVKGAFLDQQGIMHLIFMGGDETDANIYYTQAPAIKAGLAPAWSAPLVVGEAANNPDVAALAGDGKGKLVIVYSGRAEGPGLYTLYSTDNGATWTKAVSTFLTYSDLFPMILKLDMGPSGLLHMVWDLRNVGGQGRLINYAHLDLRTWQWSDVVTLAETDSGYGVLIPTVIEYQQDVIVAYNGVTMRRSSDGGQTWSDPITPFRLTGVNGIMSFVVDSSDSLHFLWAQRITGSPDIHGVWHSVWRGGSWSEPVPVVSGPQISDFIGTTAFDPYDVSAVVSQGNALLATWRSDPGNHGNGIWYAYTLLDTPELPLVPLPVVMPTATPKPTATYPAKTVSATATAQLRPSRLVAVTPERQSTGDDPVRLVLVALLPVVLLVTGVLLQARYTNKQGSR